MKEPQRDGARAWLIACLLFLAQTLNYFDKSVLSLAAPSMMDELGLTRQQYGWVASSFFSLYAVSGVLVGLLLAHRMRSKTLLSILVLVWSLSQLPIFFTSSVAILIACRVALGIGEGPANPTAMSACHEWFSDRNRSMPSAVLTLGSSVGSFVAAPALSLVMVHYGWRAAFLACSALGLVWLALWQMLGGDAPGDAPVAGDAAPASSSSPAATLRQTWLDPTILSIVFVAFCAYWIAAFTVSWVAPYIRDGLHFDATQTGWRFAAVSATASVCIFTLSYLSQRLLKFGLASRYSRGLLIGICMLLGGAGFIAAGMATGTTTRLVCIALATALPMLTFAIGPTLVSEVVPAAYRSQMLIVIFSSVTIAGFFSPSVSGYLIGAGGMSGYRRAFMANAFVTIAGGLVAVLALRPDRSAQRSAALIPRQAKSSPLVKT